MVMDAGWDDAGHDNRGNAAAGKDGNFNASAAGDRTAPCMTEQKKRAEDWKTIWQSELSALAVDPEVVESRNALASLWAGTMAAMLRGMPDIKRPDVTRPDVSRHDDPPGRTAAADAPRSAPVAAAPDARDVEITRLQHRVGELERRLAALERSGDPAVHGKNRPGRKTRK